ncbi:TetR family transcriptional regulator [Roseibium hamelinense]|uniref:TetR family transcriptional regulator n=2 Tax=Roseibium hamelinense TaxID=150831 RepID=A0A562TAI7_9HYPH|nr:TetR family transcriptional regulator [Roseibium hamelinense]
MVNEMLKRETKRAELRERIIAAAEAELIEKGLSGLKARDITSRAGCALGALYNVFDDLDMLVLELNSRTLADLGNALSSSVPVESSSGRQVLQALAAAYTDFARDHQHRWMALFEHRLPEGKYKPEEYRMEQTVLIDAIVPSLKELWPELSKETLAMRARTTFAAVHGVVLLSLQQQFVGVPLKELKSEVEALVELLSRQ